MADQPDSGAHMHHLMSMLQHSGIAANQQAGEQYGLVVALMPKIDVSVVGHALGQVEQAIQGTFASAMMPPGLSSFVTADEEKNLGGLLNADRRFFGKQYKFVNLEIGQFFGSGGMAGMGIEGGSSVDMADSLNPSVTPSITPAVEQHSER